MQFNIFISETLLIPILICQILFLETEGLHVSYTVGFNTECVDDKLAFQQIIQIALNQCVVECARRKKCRGISYRERFTLCNLIDVDNPPYLSSTPADCVLVSKNDMKYQLPQTCNDCESCDLDTEHCITTECPKLTLNEGTLLGNMNSVGSRVKYTCNPGFKQQTAEAYVTCQADGTWSIVPRCVLDLCYNNPCKKGGTCTATTTDQYTCTCMYGFTGPNCEIAIIVCEGGTMNLWCPAGKLIDIKSANYGRTQDGRVCPHPAVSNTNCLLATSFQTVSSRCSGQLSCVLYVNSAFFSLDPCGGTYKYLEVDYTYLCYNNPCKNGGTCTATTIDQYTCTCTHGFTGPNCEIAIIVCEGSTMNLWCPAGKLIDIKSANYGRTQDGRVCPHPAVSNTNCRLSTSFQTVRSRCSGQHSCQLTVNLLLFGGSDPCPGTYKYLEVDYICS